MAVALQRPVDHHVQRRLGLCDPAHAVGQARRPQPVLPQPMSVAAATQDLRVVNAQVFDDDLAVPTRAVHRLDLAHPVPALAGQIDDECGVATPRALGDIQFGLGDQDRELGAVGTRDEPLVTVDDPFVAVGHSARANERRVRTGDLGLGHREARRRHAFAQRPEVLLFLLVGGPVHQRMHVAFVGRLTVQHPWPDACLGRLGLHHGQRHVAQAHAAPLFRHVRQPQSGVLGLAAQPDQFAHVGAIAVGLHLVAMPERLDGGLDDVIDEGLDPVADRFVLRRKSEVDGHDVPPAQMTKFDLKRSHQMVA